MNMFLIIFIITVHKIYKEEMMIVNIYVKFIIMSFKYRK